MTRRTVLGLALLAVLGSLGWVFLTERPIGITVAAVEQDAAVRI